MCSSKVDYKALYEELLEKYECQNESIMELMRQDSCNKYIKDIEWRVRISLIENPVKEEVVSFLLENEKYDNNCKMVTLTFDPKKFNSLINRNTQRAYMEQTLNGLINMDFGCEINMPLYGCFELHETGIVHVHFICNNIYEEQLIFLRQQLTDKKIMFTQFTAVKKHLMTGGNI